MRIRADVQGNEQVARAFRRAPRIMRDRTDPFVQRAALELARRARSLAPKASSNLVNSIKPDRIGPMDFLIGPHVQHGVYVETGTRGGGRFPPEQAILDWVKQRGIQPMFAGETQEDAAHRIARKIQRSGTPARPYMEPARQYMQDRVRLLVAQGIRQGLRDAGLA